jgi:hypothetical protein
MVTPLTSQINALCQLAQPADFRQGGALGVGEPPAWLQTRLQNAVLGDQVLILQQEFLLPIRSRRPKAVPMRLCSCSTPIIEDCDSSTHLNILTTRG